MIFSFQANILINQNLGNNFHCGWVLKLDHVMHFQLWGLFDIYLLLWRFPSYFPSDVPTPPTTLSSDTSNMNNTAPSRWATDPDWDCSEKEVVTERTCAKLIYPWEQRIALSSYAPTVYGLPVPYNRWRYLSCMKAVGE